MCVCERERETGPFLLYSRNGYNGVNQLDFNKTAFFKFTLPLSKKWKWMFLDVIFYGVFWFFCLFVCLLFRAASLAYGGSQARALIGAAAAGLAAVSATCTTAHSKAWSLTPWARPGNPSSSWILGGFANCWAVMRTPFMLIIVYKLKQKQCFQDEALPLTK